MLRSHLLFPCAAFLLAGCGQPSGESPSSNLQSLSNNARDLAVCNTKSSNSYVAISLDTNGHISTLSAAFSNNVSASHLGAQIKGGIKTSSILNLSLKQGELLDFSTSRVQSITEVVVHTQGKKVVLKSGEKVIHEEKNCTISDYSHWTFVPPPPRPKPSPAASSAPYSSQSDPEPQGHFPDFTWNGSHWLSQWSAFVVQAVEEISPNLLNDKFIPLTEIKSLCPSWIILDKQEKEFFWAIFVAGISFPESNFNPYSRYLEPHPLNKYSEGLLQLSRDDWHANGPNCNFENGRNIFSPHDNLRCGIAVLSQQIAEKHTLFPKSPYYWSVLTRAQTTVKEVIKHGLRENNLCQ